MKDLKDELKAFQKQIKALKHDPSEAMKVQKQMMQTNSKYMMHSFKPMIFTFLPIIIFFGWMSAHLAYLPIDANSEFSVDINFNEDISGDVRIDIPPGIESVNGLVQNIEAEKATFVLVGDIGEYLLTYEFNDNQYTNEIIITDERTYKQPIKKINKDGIKTIQTNIKKVMLLNIGFHTFGWLGTYIIFSIIASITMRKLMKIY